MKVQGIIQEKKVTAGEKNSKKWTRAVYKLNNITYATFDKELREAFNPGDNVELEYTEQGAFKNITNAMLLEKANPAEKIQIQTADKIQKAPQSVWDDKDRRMVRMNALSHGVKLFDSLPNGKKEPIEDPISFICGVAEAFEVWVYRK